MSNIIPFCPLLFRKVVVNSPAFVPPPQLSVPSTIKVTEAPQTPGSLSVTISAGHVIVGSSTSLTVTLNVQLTVFPSASVTLNSTIVVPVGNVPPLTGPIVVIISPEISPISGSLADAIAI